jgi:hypothetical protein
MRDGEKNKTARMVREVHRLHTPESLLVVSDDGPAELFVEISPSELLEPVTTFSTAPSLCA